MRNPQGLFVISVVRDITERKHSAEQIKKLNAELGEGLRRAELLGATGELATNMAREIENTLATLQSCSRTLSAADTGIKELVGKAHREVG